MREDIKNALDRNKDANKFFTTTGFKKNYERIEKFISKDEEVLYIRNGNVKMDSVGKLKENAFNIKDKSPVILAVTNKRLLIYFKILFEEKLEQIPIKEIRNFDFKRNGLTSSVFRITSLTRNIDFDLPANEEEILLLNNVLAEVTII